MQFNPQSKTEIQSGDILIVLGQNNEITALEKEIRG